MNKSASREKLYIVILGYTQGCNFSDFFLLDRRITLSYGKGVQA